VSAEAAGEGRGRGGSPPELTRSLDGPYSPVRMELPPILRLRELEARKVISSRDDVAPSAADVLAEPIVTCRATGTTIVPRAQSRIDR